jgi:hypothetical protein
MHKQLARWIWLGWILCALPLAAGAAPWKWVCYGDTRTNDASHRAVLAAIAAHTPDYQFIIHVGDMEVDGSVSAGPNSWASWKQAVDDNLGTTALDPTGGQLNSPPQFMGAPGNHENIGTPAGQTNWSNFLPGQTQRYGNGGRFYWFDYNNARFVVMDTETTVDDINGAQRTMLLNAIQHNPQDWLFVIWHIPIFAFGAHTYNEAGVYTPWGAPLYQNGCDIILNGHAHYYCRTVKLGLNGQQVVPKDPLTGTVQVVTGNGGAPLAALDEALDANYGNILAYSYDQSQAAYFGYTELTIDGKTCTLKHYAATGPLQGIVTDTATYTANPKPGWVSVSTPTATTTPTPTPTPTIQLTPPAPPRGLRQR